MQIETSEEQDKSLNKAWLEASRWDGVTRPYKPEDVFKLQPSLKPQYTLAKHGAEKLWKMMREAKTSDYTRALGAVTGAQAVNMVRAGLSSIYVYWI